MIPARVLPPVALTGLLALAGCGGNPTAPHKDNVFYVHGSSVIDKKASYEIYYQPLNAPASKRTPQVVGVGVFDGDVRFGRPIDWTIRNANNKPGERFITYQSPRQFLFTIIERPDHPQDPWPDVLLRYEGEIEGQGGQILAARLPMATSNTQGRGYLIKTKVPGKPADFEGYAHEYLIRGDVRILLVQVVHPASVEPLADEVAQALTSIVAY